MVQTYMIDERRTLDLTLESEWRKRMWQAALNQETLSRVCGM